MDIFPIIKNKIFVPQQKTVYYICQLTKHYLKYLTNPIFEKKGKAGRCLAGIRGDLRSQ